MVKRFKSFHNAVDRITHKPDIWLTEQGVLFSRAGARRGAAYSSEDIARIIMHGFVEDGTSQLTRQSKQITRFFYYETRGEDLKSGNQDSGLLCPSSTTTPHCHTSAPRSTYYVYRNKTPSS
jgi:hypothetical protein